MTRVATKAATITLLTVGLATCLTGRPAAQSVFPPPGLISWWPMDGTAEDIAGANQPSETNALRFVRGRVGCGVSFETGGYIRVAGSPSLSLQRFTIETWVRPDGPGSNPDTFGSTIVAKSVSGSEESASLFWRSLDGRFLFLFGTVPGEMIISTRQFPTGVFHHVAATYDGSSFKLYVNGVLEGEKQLVKTIAYNTSIDWSIGAQAPQFPTHPRTWNGVIDEFTIYGRALDASEIQAILDTGACGKVQGVVRAATALAALSQSLSAQVPHTHFRNRLLSRLEAARQVLVDANRKNDVSALHGLYEFLRAVHSRDGRRILGALAYRVTVDTMRIVGNLRGVRRECMTWRGDRNGHHEDAPCSSQRHRRSRRRS